VEVPALTYEELASAPAEATVAVAARVHCARQRQLARGPGAGAATNALLTPAALRVLAVPDERGRQLLATAIERFHLSGRAHDRVLRVARTLADLEGTAQVSARHVAEALQFRRCALDTD
jgi:magnesium chelatase family protein